MSEEEIAFKIGEMMGRVISIGAIGFGVYFIVKKLFGKKEKQ